MYEIGMYISLWNFDERDTSCLKIFRNMKKENMSYFSKSKFSTKKNNSYNDLYIDGLYDIDDNFEFEDFDDDIEYFIQHDNEKTHEEIIEEELYYNDQKNENIMNSNMNNKFWY